MAGLAKAKARLEGFANGLQSVGSQLVRVGMGAAIPLGLSAKAFGEFEFAMARVKAILSPTEKEFADLSAEAKRLGLTTEYSATQAAQTMGVFAMAGYDAATTIKALAPTLNFASSQTLELAQAADIGMKVMAGMGIGTEKLADTFDLLSRAAIRANTDVAMLGEAFKFVGPIAGVAGVDLSEITSAIMLLSDAGIQGEMAGTTLRGMILSLTSPSEEAKKVLRDLGIQVNDAKGNFRGIIPIIKDFQRSLAGRGSGEVLGVLGQIFDARQAAGAARLVSLGAAQLEKRQADLMGAAGENARMSGIKMDTLYGALKLVISAVEGLAIEIGKNLAPILREFQQSFTSIFTIVAEFIKKNGDLVKQVAKVTLAIMAGGAALIAFSAAIKTVLFAFSGIALILAPLKILLAVVGTLGIPLSALIIDLVRLAKSAGIVDSILKGLSNTAWQVTQSFGRLSSDVHIAMQGISDALAINDGQRALEIAAIGIKSIWWELWASIEAAAMGVWDSIVDSVAKAFNNVIAIVQEAITGAISAVWLAFNAVFRAITGSLGMISDKLFEMQENKRLAWVQKTMRNIERDRAGREEGIDAASEAEAKARNAAIKANNPHRAILEQLASDAAATRAGGSLGAAAAAGLVDALKPKAEVKAPTVGGVLGGLGKTEASGTFNAALAAQMGASSVTQQIAENTKRTAEAVEKANRQDTALRFA